MSVSSNPLTKAPERSRVASLNDEDVSIMTFSCSETFYTGEQKTFRSQIH